MANMKNVLLYTVYDFSTLSSKIRFVGSRTCKKLGQNFFILARTGCGYETKSTPCMSESIHSMTSNNRLLFVAHLPPPAIPAVAPAAAPPAPTPGFPPPPTFTTPPPTVNLPPPGVVIPHVGAASVAPPHLPPPGLVTFSQAPPPHHAGESWHC